ncbi:MAG: 16S rRNA (cytidine(1402)-2'-O)-methyltransferase [Lachnospiraceae bacterium]|nr:16S rRNA (cytidine(1402)-2'-O)-methyltransferase [Lachnospiraceae bacterium]
MSGTLFLCATPIGNRGDITERVKETLSAADLIAAEDTRHSRGLLEHYGISKPLTSYHEHNKYEKAEELLGLLLEGKNIALITDAGTPAISDPGEVLVRRCHEAGVPVTSLPGPCALITALSLSGFPARRFVFEGFLPQETKERKAVLASLAGERRTIILYEAPHRLVKTLNQLQETLGSRRICICRELTKIHEEAVWTTLSEAVRFWTENEPRGEYVLVLEGLSEEEAAAEDAARWSGISLTVHLQQYLDEGLDKKEAMKRMAEDRGMSRREVYQGLLEEEKEIIRK